MTRWLRAQGLPCWICGMPIEYGEGAAGPRSFQCDELVPVSRGGSPLDRGNVAASHACCNNWRRNKPVYLVERVRAASLARFGPPRSPEEFVARAKAVERFPDAGRAVEPPRTTTAW